MSNSQNLDRYLTELTAPSSIRLNISEVQRLLSFLKKNGSPNLSTIRHRGWTVATLDDKALFDDDAKNIGRAFAAGGATEFLG